MKPAGFIQNSILSDNPLKMNKLLFIILLISFPACRHSGNELPETRNRNRNHGGMEHQRKRAGKGHESVESRNIVIKGDTVFVPSGSTIQTKLEIHTTNTYEYVLQFTTTGVVRPLSGHKAEVASPFVGRITKSFVKLGQHVAAGTPLFEVSSSDYLESVRMFLQASREKELTEKNYLRKKDLMDSGITSKREFDEARFEFELAEKEYEKAAAVLKIFNIDTGDADLARPLTVRSPIAGEVVKVDITAGQYVKSDSDPMVTIADLEKVMVIASVREKDLGSVNLQDQVEIFTESLPDKPTRGVVNYLGNIMNEENRSVEVFIECLNHSRDLKCGMFVTIKFYHNLSNAIIIPASAVLQDYNKSYLFVKAGPDVFVRREIAVTSIPDKRMIVHSGLKTGDIIVSEGGIYLQ